MKKILNIVVLVFISTCIYAQSVQIDGVKGNKFNGVRAIVKNKTYTINISVSMLIYEVFSFSYCASNVCNLLCISISLFSV